MSGTVLSTLCGICHAQPPKYKCPRCGARTCSVPCIQKHKARADCDGVRNPRAFMPLSQLKTEAGIDHDFNFLTSIERARERAEKDIIEARRLLSEKDLRPPNEDKLYQKIWHGDELRHVPVRPQVHVKHGRPKQGSSFVDSGGFDKHVRRRLRHLNIETVMMPKGMARQRENKTSFNRRTQTINWQVEWLVYGASQLGLPRLQADQQQQQPLRVMYKGLEGTPLNTALATALEWHRGQLDRQAREQQHDPEGSDNNELDDSPPRKKRKSHHHRHKRSENKPSLLPVSSPPPTVQDPTTCTWPAAPYPAQYPLTSAWSQTSITSPSVPTTLEEQLSSTWRFYLLKAGRPMPNPKTLIPLAATENLTGVLAGRTVVEFPTVVVMPSSSTVPWGYVIGDPAERRRQPRVEGRPEEEGRVRGYAGGRGDGRDHGRKRPFDEGIDRNHHRNADARGGKRVRFENGRPPPAREAVVAEPDSDDDEIEEGEVRSDENEVMAEPDGRVSGEAVELDGESSSESESESEDESDSGSDSSATIAEDREQQQEEEEEGGIRATEGVKVQGGLVDYGSSDDSD
ncbi:hypothetical protein C8A03DRAFT_40494 [Achaetomium macrosporum]|uniref:Box C/D snoRNA protein 1 n=1 Tax=Achaetomium macrosporum TaxID=79813 RepID=A0AAN7HHG4_9PEZI|nr:hypothetical protein C8A03DRAFT_40494 [Achaetomium macrosporum]